MHKNLNFTHSERVQTLYSQVAYLRLFVAVKYLPNHYRTTISQENDISFSQIMGIYPPATQRHPLILVDVEVPQRRANFEVFTVDYPKRMVCGRPNFTTAEIKRYHQSIVI